MTIVAPRPIEFPYTFPFPTKDTLSLLEDRGISLDVGRIIVSYSLVPRKVMFLGIHNVLYKYGCQPNSLNGEAISNLKKTN